MRARAYYSVIRESARESHASRHSLWLLLVVNLYSIAVAVHEDWPVQHVVLLYWLQNVVIGVLTCVRLLTWNNITTADSSPAMERGFEVTRFVVGFFGVHALMFATFAGFYDVLTTFSAVRVTFAVFVANHGVSFILNHRRDTATPTTYGRICEQAFIRMLPLHLWPVFLAVVFVPSFMILMIAYLAGVDEHLLSDLSSGFPAVAVVLFMALKAVCEVPAHLVSHSDRRLTRP